MFFIFGVTLLPIIGRSDTWTGTYSFTRLGFHGCDVVSQGDVTFVFDEDYFGTATFYSMSCLGIDCDHKVQQNVVGQAQLDNEYDNDGNISYNLSFGYDGSQCSALDYNSLGFHGNIVNDVFEGDERFFDIVAHIVIKRISNKVPKAEGNSSNPGSVCCGDPIDLGTGNMFHEVTDFATADGRLSFTRYYNSSTNDSATASSLGKQWRSNFDRYLRIGYSGGVIASATSERANGAEYPFNLTNNGKWKADSDVDLSLTNTVIQNTTYWILHDENDDGEVYQQVGNTAYLIRTQTRGGYRQDLVYSGLALTSVKDSFGRGLQFAYKSNLLETVTAPDGFICKYGYTSGTQGTGVLDRLSSVSYSTDPITGLAYRYELSGSPFALTGVMDENNQRVASWRYDSFGRALSSEDAGGVGKIEIAYGDKDGSRVVKNPLKLSSTYAFTNFQGVPKMTAISRPATIATPASDSHQVYDTNGYVVAITDWNQNVTSFTKDSRGLPTKVVEASNTNLSRATVITNRTDFHLPVRIVIPGKTVDFVYDGNGNILERSETDTTDNSVPYPTRGKVRTWKFTYNDFGQVLSATGPRTDVTTTTFYSYETNGNPTSITDPRGHVTKFTRYNDRGLPLEMVDVNGVTNRFTYHVRGWLLTREVLAASGNAITTFAYDAAGQMTAVTLPDGSSLRYQYDPAHRLHSISNLFGESITYTLDAAGNITQQDTKGGQGHLSKTQSRVFDELGRLFKDIGANGQTNQYGYDGNGNTILAVDGLNRMTGSSFDALDRLVSMTDPVKSIIGTGYDDQDNLVSVSDPRVLATTYVHDGFGRVIQESSPDKGVTVYRLDEAGNRVSETDARGVVTLRTFDELNRVISQTFPASPTENIAYGYDSTNGGNFGLGRLTSFSDETGSTALVYNERGDLVATTRNIAGKSYTTAYSYDLADHITSVTYPSGHVFNYGRDSLGRINAANYQPTAAVAPVQLASKVTYLPFGPVSGFVYGNGFTRTHGFDLDYRLVSISTASDATSVQGLGLAYDEVNNITAITNLLDSSRNQWFSYDENYRLTNAVGSYGTIGYAYDGVGNRAVEVSNGETNRYAYPTNANRLDSVLGSTPRGFTYTAAGNTETDNRGAAGTYGYGYGARNRLKTLTLNGNAIATYAYNAFGQRLVKVVGAATTHFHYDQQSHLIAESDGQTGAMLREYVWLGNMPLAVIEGDGTVYFIHCDHLNTPQKMTDGTQAVVWAREQKPFGETTTISTGVPAPELTESGFDGQGRFRLAVNGVAGASYALQKLGDLSGTELVSVSTNKAPFTFTDIANASTRTQFYRAVALDSNGGREVTMNLRFPGQYYDAESGLSYNAMRDYDSISGRYIESDPLGVMADVSIYVYCEDIPTRLIDSNGLEVWIGGRFPHQNINVGNPEGTYYTYSFALNPTWSVNDAQSEGQIYRDAPPTSREYQYGYIATTPAQDLKIIGVLNDLVANNEKFTYNVYSQSCRTFSQEMFEVIKKAYKKQYVPPPVHIGFEE